MVIRAESRIPSATLRELEARGHVLDMQSAWGGGGAVQVIERDAGGVLRGGSDPRGGGLALGV